MRVDVRVQGNHIEGDRDLVLQILDGYFLKTADWISGVVEVRRDVFQNRLQEVLEQPA